MKKLTSISGKIVSLVSVSMIVVVSIVMMIIIPRAKSNISTVTENYMIDLATITGEQIENVRAEKGSNVAFNVGTLSRMVRNVAVSDSLPDLHHAGENRCRAYYAFSSDSGKNWTTG